MVLLMVGKYISMVVCDRRQRDLLVRAGWASMGVGVGSGEAVGESVDVMVWESWSSCQMSQCSTLHSWADWGAWGSGV